MSLLQDVQAAAIDASVPISTLLRKCAVLAIRLNNDELRAWVAKELNGYKSADDVPGYRILGAPATGNLSGQFRSGQNITIPPTLLPDWGRKYAEEMRFMQPIATIEDLGKGNELVTARWPDDLILYMQTEEGNKFADDLVLDGVWQSVAAASVLGIVDTVRNRVLEFALRLEKEAPDAGEPEKPGSAVSDAAVRHLYQTVIHGDVIGNVATGSHAVQTTGDIKVNKGDLEALRKRLGDWGIAKADVDELEAALKEDPAENLLAEKPRTIAWLSKMYQKTVTGAVKLTSGVSTDLIAQIVGQYLGIDTIP